MKDEMKQEESFGLIELLLQSLIEIPRLMRDLKFAIWVIVILAIFTLIGTILPQQHLSNDPIGFGQNYANLFHVDPSDGINNFREFIYRHLIVKLELYNIFQSGLYFVLMVLLTISSCLCAWDRFKISRKILKLTKPKISRDSILNMKHSMEGGGAVDPKTASEKFRQYVTKKGFHVFDETDGDGNTWFFIRKNSFFHIVSVVFHASLVLILIGGIIGNERVAGFEGVIALREGESRPIANEKHLEELAGESGLEYLPLSDEMIELVEYQNIYRERDFPGIDSETGFPVGYHGMPSDYVSHLRVVKPGDDGTDILMAEKAIEVNVPLRYKGISYFQSSINAVLHFTITGTDQRRIPMETFLNQPMDIPQLGVNITVTTGDIAGGIYEMNDGTRAELPYVVRMIDYAAPQMGITESPILIGYVSEGRPVTVGGVEISLDSVTEYTILHYVYDPGVLLAYIGGLLLIVGLTITLYLPYRMARIYFTRSETGFNYTIGGNWSGVMDMTGSVLTGMGDEDRAGG